MDYWTPKSPCSRLATPTPRNIDEWLNHAAGDFQEQIIDVPDAAILTKESEASRKASEHLLHPANAENLPLPACCDTERSTSIKPTNPIMEETELESPPNSPNLSDWIHTEKCDIQRPAINSPTAPHGFPYELHSGLPPCRVRSVSVQGLITTERSASIKRSNPSTEETELESPPNLPNLSDWIHSDFWDIQKPVINSRIATLISPSQEMRPHSLASSRLRRFCLRPFAPKSSNRGSRKRDAGNAPDNYQQPSEDLNVRNLGEGLARVYLSGVQVSEPNGASGLSAARSASRPVSHCPKESVQPTVS